MVRTVHQASSQGGILFESCCGALVGALLGAVVGFHTQFDAALAIPGGLVGALLGALVGMSRPETATELEASCDAMAERVPAGASKPTPCP